LTAVASASIFICSGTDAWAGAPLKGIDVKLGKNPGGGCAARAQSCTGGHNVVATGDDGSADFGVLPEGGYIVTLDGAAAKSASVTVTGAAESKTADPSGIGTVSFHADGKQDVVVRVSGGGGLMPPAGHAKVKSHSNTNNN
jgi:hypothetical protein